MKTTLNSLRASTVLAVLLLIFAVGMALAPSSDKMPAKADIEAAIDEAYTKYQNLEEGKNADYIPALAEVDPNIFGIVLVTTDGQVYSKGDITSEVSIQSISKVFTLARVIEESGAQLVEDKIGVDPTGLRFNSIVAIELQRGKEINPLVNPGAIAATSLVQGSTYEEKWNNILQAHSDFAGRQLEVNQPVYESEAATNQRNQAIAMLLNAYERMYYDPAQSTDIYTKQCAINVNARDLGVMAATLANGGVNPVSKKKVVSPETVARVLPVMAMAGLYDNAGIWFYHVGLPAKSGVGGGLIAVASGKFGIAVVSPPLDASGNSVKAQKAITDIVNRLHVNPYMQQPK